MKTGKLKSVCSPDVDDIQKYRPEDEAFNILLELYIGMEDDDGEEQFQIEVCSPRWIEQELSKSTFVIPRHRIISTSFNYEMVIAEVKRVIKLCSGNDWNEIASKLSRWFSWEFEDYTE